MMRVNRLRAPQTIAAQLYEVGSRAINAVQRFYPLIGCSQVKQNAPKQRGLAAFSGGAHGCIAQALPQPVVCTRQSPEWLSQPSFEIVPIPSATCGNDS